MGRKNRTIEGRVYITNDALFSNDGYRKSGRRIVVINEDKNEAVVCKIKGIKRPDGSIREKLIPIERYSCLTKDSGVDPKVYKKTRRGNNIEVSKMKKTTTRLNKWDMKKVKEKVDK